MHVIKIILLLLLTLALMRIASWTLGRLLNRYSKMQPLGIAVLSNLGALGLFMGVLIGQNGPGELFDGTELAFGIAVFTLYALYDLKWSNLGK
jgi:hypothetical protein